MKKIAHESMKIDSLQVVDDRQKCCLKVNAVITRVGVYQYPDGLAFKSPMELLKATYTAKNAKITIMDHPDSMVIMSQKQIYGSVENPFFERDRIRATLNFDKKVCPPQFLHDVRTGHLKDVSIGFYYQPDVTPGAWNGQHYDYVMRDIVIDHVAAGVPKGRCSFPSCGIGVDAMMRRIALDPFGDYTDFADCVAKNQDKTNPQAFCAWLHKKITGKTPAEDSHKFIGGKKTMAKKTMSERKTHEELEAEFNECVRRKMEEGAVYDPPMTRGQAEALCAPATEPEDEPKPVPEHLDQEELSAWQKCIKAKTEAGMSTEEATAECKEEGVVKGDQDAAFENCVTRKMEEGKTREEAEKECREEHPIAKEDDEPEPTPLERCIKDRIEAEGESEEEATNWCKAELAGEHEAVDSMIERSKNLINMRAQRDIERRRASRRHPV